MKQLQRIPDFNFHPIYVSMNVVQLSFADDLLLFCRGDTISIQLLYSYFQVFSNASWLVANVDKKAIYFGGVQSDIQEEILQVLGFSKGTLPTRYLGAPLSTKRVSIVQCQP